MGALLEGVEFQLQVSLGLSDEEEQALYDEALYDEGVYSADELYWINFGSRQLRVETRRGRDRYGDRFPPGSMSFLLDDQDGIFNPDAGAVQIGGQQFRVGRFARLVGRESPAAEWVPLWMGRIETLTEQFKPGGGDVNMAGTCIDLQQWLQRINPPALPSPVPAGQATGARVSDVLTRAGYPPAWQRPGDIDSGVHTMLESSYGQSYLQLCQQAAEAEDGAFFVGPEGFFRFRQQDWLTTDDPKFIAGAPGQPIQVVGLQNLRWDAGRVRNDVQISRRGGTAQRVVSSASQAFYQARTYRRLDLEMETDAQAFDVAQRQVDFWQWDVAYLSELELVPTTPAAVRQLMELELGDYIILQVRTLRGWDYTIGAWVQRIAHRVTADDWNFQIVVENADRGQPGSGGPYSSAYDDSYSPVGGGA